MSAAPPVSQVAPVVVAAPARLRNDDAAAFARAAQARLPSAGGRLDVDLAPLADFDSSALAALLSLSRAAAARQVLLRCVNMPANLRKLAALYGVDGLLAGSASPA